MCLTCLHEWRTCIRNNRKKKRACGYFNICLTRPRSKWHKFVMVEKNYNFIWIFILFMCQTGVDYKEPKKSIVLQYYNEETWWSQYIVIKYILYCVIIMNMKINNYQFSWATFIKSSKSNTRVCLQVQLGYSYLHYCTLVTWRITV